MAKAVGIVEANHRLPLLGMKQLQLHSKLGDSLATPPIRAANTDLIWNKVDEPSPIGDIWVRQFALLNG